MCPRHKNTYRHLPGRDPVRTGPMCTSSFLAMSNLPRYLFDVLLARGRQPEQENAACDVTYFVRDLPDVRPGAGMYSLCFYVMK